MISRTNGGGLKVALLGTLLVSSLNGWALSSMDAARISTENNAHLIESVAAHLRGVAELERVNVGQLDWSARDNVPRQHVLEAVKSFKNSQVLISQALANSALLVNKIESDQKERLRLQLSDLRARTDDLCTKNSGVIKSLEAHQLPATESVQELTRMMLGALGLGLEVAQQPSRRPLVQ